MIKRAKAIVRCVYQGILPPFLEKKINGHVHYYPEWTYVTHLKLNLRLAWELLTFQTLSKEDKEFHKLD